MNIFADFALIPEFARGLDFLGKFARSIIEGVGSIGLGIILFTLVLKAITLPFDVYQRYKTRKQTLIMRSMKDDLDKLQKQYANDKTTYNQKMMELYKKHGYSMFGACLPMLISIIILIVAFQGFNSYARHANVKQFVGMAEAYNAAVLEHGINGNDYHLPIDGVEDDELVIKLDENGEWTLEENGILYVYSTLAAPAMNVYDAKGDPVTVKDENGNVQKDENGNPVYLVVKGLQIPRIKVCSVEDTKFLGYTYTLGGYSLTYSPDAENANEEGVVITFVAASEFERNYQIEVNKFRVYLSSISEQNEDAAAAQKRLNELWPESDETVNDDTMSAIRGVCTSYLVKEGAVAARDYYYENRPKFIWIKNVWESDATYKHPVPTTTPVASLDQGQFNNLISEIKDQQKAYNGYYILIILSIGTMILSQIITMRSQKETNKYQTVDGQGAKTQKFMLFIMPALYAVFAFMYSAAFSIYMIISSVMTLLVTLLCNLILGRIFKKKEDRAIKDRIGHRLAWMDGDKSNKSKRKRK